MDRIPIERASQLDALDNKEVAEGYLDGFGNSPAPGNNRSYSYWHGWRNGMVDAGYAVPDSSQRQLAKDVIETGYLRKNDYVCKIPAETLHHAIYSANSNEKLTS